jgi:hypothetical protein
MEPVDLLKNKEMKKILYLVPIMLSSLGVAAQVKEVAKDWTSFVQSIDASFVKNKIKFRISASVKVITDDPKGSAALWIHALAKDNKTLFFNNMDDRIIKSNEWRTYVIEGETTEAPIEILVGGWCQNNGKFYFDNFEVYIQDDHGDFGKATMNNADFEMLVGENKIPGWVEGITMKRTERAKGYTLSSGEDRTLGNYSLLIEGKNIVKDSTYLIGPKKGFTPQVGTLVSMLNNMTSRVEQDVMALADEDVDNLMDSKANSIGALVLHMAAAEVYYQVFTFENREFNEEEKKKWQVALDLGDEARKTIKGHSIEYYLNIYKEVRKKTLEEFRKRNDEWLFLTPSENASFNNYFSWFHMAEHQSSHLGQIRMIKKRLPEREEQLPLEKINADH